MSHLYSRLPIASLCRRFAVAVVAAGVLWLAVAYLAGWTGSNLCLMAGLVVELIGIIMYIIGEKASDKL